MPIHAQCMKLDDHPPLKVALGVFSPVSRLTPVAVLLVYLVGVPDTLSANNLNAYGHGPSVVFWMLNWVGMASLGFPCMNMAMILEFPWSSLFLTFWVITNIATGSVLSMSPMVSIDGGSKEI
ncbi:hypothetical protein N7522_012121 [Penicillium canescens]|nr:hypothetical protein N7522_012121 [Penicillium canescens]